MYGCVCVCVREVLTLVLVLGANSVSLIFCRMLSRPNFSPPMEGVLLLPLPVTTEHTRIIRGW